MNKPALSDSPIAVVRPKSWQEAVVISQGLRRWGFRGHASAEWKLTSGLERAAVALDSPFIYLANREWWIHTQFTRRAHHYLSDPPHAERLVEWLALLQHHGGPTRLIDFTHSFYIAAFFAMEFAIEDSAVWAINLDRIEDFANETLQVQAGPKSTIYDKYQQYLIEAERIIAAQEGPAFVLPVEPARLNERLSIQQGMFMMGCDITRTFLDNLAVSFGIPSERLQATLDVSPASVSILEAQKFALIKLVLPHAVRRDALFDLRDMNITAASLFPGLDGFARSLSFYLQPSITNAELRQTEQWKKELGL